MTLREARAQARKQLRAQEAAARRPHLYRRQMEEEEMDDETREKLAQEIEKEIEGYKKEVEHLQDILDLFQVTFSDLLVGDEPSEYQEATEKEQVEEKEKEEDLDDDQYSEEEHEHENENDESDDDNDSEPENDDETAFDPLHKLKQQIQEVKSALYDRNYDLAFGSLQNLKAYVLRWSPGRALGYYNLIRKGSFKSVSDVTKSAPTNTENKKQADTSSKSKNNKSNSKQKNEKGTKKQEATNAASSEPESVNVIGDIIYNRFYGLDNTKGAQASNETTNAKQNMNVMCVGGGAGAEIVAFAALLKDIVKETSQSTTKTEPITENQGSKVQMKLTAVDIADWSPVVEQLEQSINKVWFSDTPKDNSNTGLSLSSLSLSNKPFSVDFLKQNVLEYVKTPESRSLLANQDVITTLFTINELFKADRPATMSFLQTLKLTCNKKSGNLLIFLESAGSYSNLQVGTKSFPVQFMINHVLTSPIEKQVKLGNEVVTRKKVLWKRVYHTDSTWYRIPEPKTFLSYKAQGKVDVDELIRLKYPLKLENMRYFVSVFESL